MFDHVAADAIRVRRLGASLNETRTSQDLGRPEIVLGNIPKKYRHPFTVNAPPETVNGLNGPRCMMLKSDLTSNHAPPEAPFPLVERTVAPVLPPDLRLIDEFDESLVLDVTDANAIEIDTMNWLNALQFAVMNDPNFGTVAISLDRTMVTITWFGEPSTTLQQQMDAAPEGIKVVIQPAKFQPAELQELIMKAMSPDLLSGMRITMGGAENDGSGLRFGIWELPNGSTPSDVAKQLGDIIGRPDVPITIEVAQIVPADG